MFYHLEHHLFPNVPTCHLPQLASRLDHLAPDLASKKSVLTAHAMSGRDNLSKPEWDNIPRTSVESTLDLGPAAAKPCNEPDRIADSPGRCST